mgnify:CR=1 FL=1
MKISCGIIPFRKNVNGELEFFLGHPGGNYKNCRDLWMFLKGAVEDNENWGETAFREFKEETGLTLDGCNGDMLIPLGSVQQNPHKVTVAFGLHYPNIDPDVCVSNIADDGVTPEIDKYKWMTYDEVCKYTHHTHLWFYDQLIDMDKYSNIK